MSLPLQLISDIFHYVRLFVLILYVFWKFSFFRYSHMERKKKLNILLQNHTFSLSFPARYWLICEGANSPAVWPASVVPDFAEVFAAANNPKVARRSLAARRYCPKPADHRCRLIRRCPSDRRKTRYCRCRPRMSLKHAQSRFINYLFRDDYTWRRKKEDLTFGQSIIPGGRLGCSERSSSRGTSRGGRGPGDLESFRAFVPGDATLLQQDFVTELLRQSHHFGEVFGWQWRPRHQELLGSPFARQTSLLRPLVGAILKEAASRRVLQVFASVLQARAEST